MGKMFGFVCGFGPGVERNYSRKRCELRMVRAAKLRAETTKAKKVDDLIDDIQNKVCGEPAPKATVMGASGNADFVFSA